MTIFFKNIKSAKIGVTFQVDNQIAEIQKEAKTQNFPSEGKMRSQKSTKFINIKVKTLNHSIFQIFANPSEPIFTVQGQIQQKTSVPIAAQRLLYRGINLQPTRSFSNYNIGENNIISLIANKLPSQFSQSSSLRRSQIHKIKSLNKQHQRYKKHMLLQQRTNGFRLNPTQAIEVMAQNRSTIEQLLNCVNYNYAQESMPFKLDKRKVRVGEWVDVRDLSGQWAEGQVIAGYDEYVKVHYNGWPERMNEWIPETSDRLVPFRTHTVQCQDSIYLSPCPKYQTLLSKSTNPSFQPLIQTLIQQTSSTIQTFTNLLKDLQLQDKQFSPQHYPFIQHQHQHSEHSVKNNAENLENLENNLKDIDEVELDRKEEFYTPSKEIRANDNLSNKAEDDVVSKCDKDDISQKSNKSFKSKRSQGLVDTQSMKSLIIDQKKRSNKIFFDSTQAQSVKSVKGKNQLKYHYYNHQQQNIVQQSDSQVGDQQEAQNYVTFRKKQYKRKMKASQLAPLSDRLGRLLVDLAPHFAMLGYQEQAINNFSENLSTFTNEGSLQSKLAKAQRIVNEEEEKNPYYSQSPYCQFQVPVMLTPNQISKLTKLLEEERRQNQSQL